MTENNVKKGHKYFTRTASKVTSIRNEDFTYLNSYYCFRKILKESEFTGISLQIMYILSLTKILRHDFKVGLDLMHIYNITALNKRTMNRNSISVACRAMKRLGYVEEVSLCRWRITESGLRRLSEIENELKNSKVIRNRQGLPGHAERKVPDF